MILVSACLLGEACTYSGGDNFSSSLCAFLEDKKYITCCPEQLGGLPTPRPPAEIQDGDGTKVLSQTAHVQNCCGQDVTEAFLSGAYATLDICRQKDVDTAILKEGSPSCGVKRIYDGSFSRRNITGQGVTSALLGANGIYVYSSEDFADF